MIPNIPRSESCFFFPLRTNVGFYEDNNYPLHLVNQIKQASLLYDNLLFESGLYSAAVLETGMFDLWTPPHLLLPHSLEKFRNNFRIDGGESAVIIHANDNISHSVLQGKVIRRWQIEFHTAVHFLQAENLPWIHFESFSLTDHGKSIAKRASNHLQQILQFEQVDAQLNQKYIKSKIIGNIGHDLALTFDENVSMSASHSHAPLFRRYFGLQPAPGFASLEIVVPDVSRLSWREIVDLRAEKCIQQLRTKLFDIEKRVLDAVSESEVEEGQYIGQINQKILDEMAQEVTARISSAGEIAGSATLDLLLGAIPIPGLSTGLNAIRDLAIRHNERNSWVVGFQRLRSTSSK